MRRLTATLFAILVSAGLLVGCGESDDTAALPTDQVSEPSGEATESDPDSDQEESVTPQQEQAIADLAERLEVGEGEIEVVSVEDVTWPDGSLGCPEPGKMYTQAMVDGQRFVLAHDGTEYAYHSGGDRAPFHCEDPEPAGS